MIEVVSLPQQRALGSREGIGNFHLNGRHFLWFRGQEELWVGNGKVEFE